MLTPEKMHDITQMLLHRLRIAAEHGKKELLVMRFPNLMCTDNGRAINNSEPGWPATLTGRPRQAYEFWHERLHPVGYGLRAMIVDWPDGMPGDVGLFLTWEITRHWAPPVRRGHRWPHPDRPGRGNSSQLEGPGPSGSSRSQAFA